MSNFIRVSEQTFKKIIDSLGYLEILELIGNTQKIGKYETKTTVYLRAFKNQRYKGVGHIFHKEIDDYMIWEPAYRKFILNLSQAGDI